MVFAVGCDLDGCIDNQVVKQYFTRLLGELASGKKTIDLLNTNIDTFVEKNNHELIKKILECSKPYEDIVLFSASHRQTYQDDFNNVCGRGAVVSMPTPVIFESLKRILEKKGKKVSIAPGLVQDILNPLPDEQCWYDIMNEGYQKYFQSICSIVQKKEKADFWDEMKVIDGHLKKKTEGHLKILLNASNKTYVYILQLHQTMQKYPHIKEILIIDDKYHFFEDAKISFQEYSHVMPENIKIVFQEWNGENLGSEIQLSNFSGTILNSEEVRCVARLGQLLLSCVEPIDYIYVESQAPLQLGPQTSSSRSRFSESDMKKCADYITELYGRRVPDSAVSVGNKPMSFSRLSLADQTSSDSNMLRTETQDNEKPNQHLIM